MIVRENEDFMSSEGRPGLRSHPVDHAPIAIAPSAVADIIREAAGEVAGGRR
jgi:hypothetical protein